MKKINPETLVPMDIFAGDKDFALEIDLDYARNDNLLFGEAIYRPRARLWLHEDLAKVVLLASLLLKRQNLVLVLHDGLRTAEAQAKMTQTKRALENPQWTKGVDRLLSPPGLGGHPRGMAIDASLKTVQGKELDMGTPFDELAADASADKNPAHRDYPGHSPEVMKNRQILELAMTSAADSLQTPLMGLPAEWWDFRQPKYKYKPFAPLKDCDLPPQMRMTDVVCDNDFEDFPDEHFEELKTALREEVLSLT